MKEKFYWISIGRNQQTKIDQLTTCNELNINQLNNVVEFLFPGMDEFEYFIDEDNDENDSVESDSGISTGSSTNSISSFYEEPTNDMITEIVKEINSQNPIFIREMILFSINGILSKDIRLSSSALVFIWKLFKLTSSSDNPAVEKILLNCPELLSSIKLLIFDPDNSNGLDFYVSGVFHYASKSKIGCEQILEYSIDGLIEMIKSISTPVVYYSFTCMHNILLNIPKSRELFNKNYDLSSLIQRLICPEEIFKSKLELITIDMLSRLATENDANKQLLFDRHVAHKCVRAVLETKTTKALIVNGQMIRIMSTNNDCKTYLIHNFEFVDFLIEQCLQINNSYNCRVFWSIILNLSDKLLIGIVENKSKIIELINAMVKFVKHFRKFSISNEIVGLILCCLSNFSCHQEWVKDIIWKKGIQFTIVDFLKMERKSSSNYLSYNAIEACYRCLNHIIDKISVTRVDFIQNNHFQIVSVLEHLKIKKVEDDLHHKLICLSINDIKRMKSYSTEEVRNLLPPLRTWVILMRHILTIEFIKNPKRKSNRKFYQVMMKSIQNEVSKVLNFLRSKCLQKHQIRSQEEDETLKDMMVHLNFLINLKETA